MKNSLFSVLFLFCTITAFAQPNQLWKSYYSYNKIVNLTQSETKVFGAAENSLVIKDVATNVLSTRTTIDGLSGQTISALYHSVQFNKTFLGYENGLMLVINENDGSIVNVVDIINKNIPAMIKRVNHFAEFDGTLYISCDFGIVQYNIATLGFGDTYFMGPGGLEIKVNQTAVHDGFIYAATQQYGIRRAAISNPNLIDFNQWSTVENGSYGGVASFAGDLFAGSISGLIQKFNGTNFTYFNQLPTNLVDFRATETHLVATDASRVTLFDTSLVSVLQFYAYQIPGEYTPLTAATVLGSTVYVGTSTRGIVAVDITNPTVQEIILPSGPLRNSIFSINSKTENLWAVYGGYSSFLTPGYNPFGFSKLNDTGWKHIMYADFKPPTHEVLNLVRVTVNPTNSNEIYVSSYYNGLLKFQNDELVEIYNATNSTLQPIFATDAPTENIRVNQTAFDKNGNLWVTDALVQNALNVLRPNGNWNSFDVGPVIDSYLSAFYTQMVIDKNNTIWIGTYDFGLIAFNENGNIFKKLRFGGDNGNLPSDRVRALAIDNRNQLWIGTDKGLRVLPSVDRFLSDTPLTSNQIIIEEEGLAQELLFEQFVSDIVVDGANNKWVGTADSGVYFLSPNGQETKYHFTKDNSPLPSNAILDIDINSTTGEVFFVTEKGMVSFKGVSTKAGDNLKNVIVYPNPVRPNYVGTVKITGLLDKATVKITDIEGNLVYEVVSEGGTIEWDTTAFGKYRVASGVYMLFISAQDASETTVKKVMIIR